MRVEFKNEHEREYAAVLVLALALPKWFMLRDLPYKRSNAEVLRTLVRTGYIKRKRKHGWTVTLTSKGLLLALQFATICLEPDDARLARIALASSASAR